MDKGSTSRTRLPARTKLPAASSSIPKPSTSAQTTKRTATTAQLDNGEVEHALTRRKEKVEAFSATMTKNALERRVADAEQAKKTLEAELTKLKHDKEKVERDRRWFAEREQSLADEKEEQRREFDKEKSELTTELRDSRALALRLQRELDTLSEAHDALQQTAMKANRISEEAQTQLSALQTDSERHYAEAAKYRKLYQEKVDELEHVQQNARATSASSRDSKEWELLRSQILQQTEEIRRLEDANAKANAELLVLRERNANIELLTEEKRVLERRARDNDSLREQLGMMEAEMDALREERENSIAHAQRLSDVPVSITQELAALRVEHAATVGQQQSLTATLHEREEELKRVESSLNQARDETAHLKLRLQATEAAATRAETKAKVAQQEVETLNSLLQKFTEEATSEEHDELDEVTERSQMRIVALEQMLEELKEANEALINEMNEMGGDAAEVVGNVGRGSISAMKEALLHERDAHAEALKELQVAKSRLHELEQQVEKLDEDLFRLKGDIGTGRFVPPGVRVLEMADNPASRWFGKRDEDMQRLKSENDALRTMVGSGTGASATSSVVPAGMVPKETVDVLMQEKSELEAIIKEKEKRLLRLQQIFSAKAEEFKTTVTSLVGWKFKFQQNGAVQLTSIYNPNALIVFSQPTKKSKRERGPLEGEDIKVQLIADTAPPEVMELYRTWVIGYGCVPGFLGSLSVQLFEASPEGVAKLKGT
ncbi:hypothetical protein PIIN_07998 [Serendipita indica DSM 11827]|uniref:Spindle assembly checkpoint component MAD1 n=1 Tax=Serendipita indica (strain DSM 11827) TaxID=1109443 RepID=G4TRV5_SERID|nr:hypothetical protein PIIN_07998 [Serendipita indica DSM 11827]